MIKHLRATFVVGIATFIMAPATWGMVIPYTQDWEAADMASATAVSDDGWAVFGNVFDGDPGGATPDGNFKFGYGTFPAPNGGAGFSAIATGEGGAEQGDQYLNVYSDYGCCGPGTTDEGHFDMTAPFDRVNSIVLRDQTIDTSNIGQVWEFSFDAKNPSADGCDTTVTSVCRAFIKTLDPSAGFATTNFIFFDTSSISNTDWARFSIQIDLSDAALDGQIFQIGFDSTSEQLGNTGVYYDNLNLQVVPVPAAVWLFGSALGLLAYIRRRVSA